MENSMNIEITDQLIIVHFQGEIDCVNAPVYRQQLSDLLEETNEDVVFDFKGTSFIDSSGIGLVLGRYNHLKNENRKLVLANLSKTAYKVFELSGMFALMEYVEGAKE